ncbi:hypothetical protein SAMN04488516_10737 [Desulfonauticus submarinus]|uniref:Uncharacterized protein n=1 Tax=Desulfonauticus submarinus TaxID=206665 RepID=A0A1H0EAD6_9BACT|nr:hypothetical protein [Desulfonauticus submarinus]SDN79293.1 hypothetical protein SAMN04488516_10737 [Desulfonauticus submarinus]
MRVFFRILFILLFIYPSTVFAGVTVEVTVPLAGSNELLSDLKQDIYHKAFLQACLKESESILGVSISKERLSILQDFLEPVLDKLVYGYREIYFKIGEQDIKLKLDCEINRKILRNELKKYGILFTARHKIAYDLTLQGVSPEEFVILSRLQTLAGVEVSPGAELKLTILKGKDKWAGELIFGKHEIKCISSSLKDLWLKVWAKYFALPEVMDKLTQSFVLSTTGWACAESIHNFDAQLKQWDQILLKQELIHIYLQVPSISATWNVWTLDKESLEKKLNNVLHSQNIVYSLTRRKVNESN